MGVITVREKERFSNELTLIYFHRASRHTEIIPPPVSPQSHCRSSELAKPDLLI